MTVTIRCLPRAAGVVAFGIALALTATGAPANAATGPGAGLDVEARHCVINLDVGSTTCFISIDKAITVATDGAIRDEAGLEEAAARETKTDLTDEDRIRALRLIGVMYQYPFYRGYITLFIGSRSCTKSIRDIDYQWPRPIGPVRSFRNYSNCWTNLYTYPYYQGRSTGYLDDRPTVPFYPRSFRWS
jgi:hypothetical protein